MNDKHFIVVELKLIASQAHFAPILKAKIDDIVAEIRAAARDNSDAVVITATLEIKVQR